MTHGSSDSRIVSLYVVPGLARDGDRGLLADSPRDLRRVVEAWAQGGHPVTVRRRGRRRRALRSLLGVDLPSAG